MREESEMPHKRKGKHPDKALSAVTVRSLTAPGRYPDGNGLYLVVEPSGAKRWVLRTVIKSKRCDIGLGGLSLVSLADARESAARLRRIARTNGDPLADRKKERRDIPTFEQAARQVHQSHSASFRNPRHSAQWIATLVQDVMPVFGGKRVDQVESSDVLRALSAIWLSKPETARRIRQRIKAVFDWARAAGFRSGDNPVEGITKVLPKQRDSVEHHASLPYAKVSQFVISLRDAGAGTSVKLAFEFLILTAARTGEVLGARWSEFDLDGKTWTIPADRMKAGRAHRVPLSTRCVEILTAAKNIGANEDLFAALAIPGKGADGDYVFPGQTSTKPLSNMCFHMCLRRMSQNGITPHGFRSSFRNWAAEKTNFPREVCEMALAHTLKDKTEAAYNRTDLFERRGDLMSAWSDFVTAQPGEVVRIRA
jgi:integrase